jgi:transcriptional regulator with XRE-family HTH domain
MREARQREREQLRVTGKRLALLMRKRGISVASLAANVRLQRSTLESLCSGQRNIPSDALASCARELGTSLEYLRASTDDPGASLTLA